MAVKLRLKRMGAKQKPYYRIVAADSRSSRDGSFIEMVGTYNPLIENNKVTLNEEKILKWLNNGAQPTTTVKSLLSNNGIWSKYKSSKGKSKKVNKSTKKSGE